MKKLPILITIVALAFGATGATCMSNVATTVCNPSASVIATAKLVISLLLPELNVLVPGSGAFDAYITAQNIASGLCVGTTELNALIAWIQGNDAKLLQTKAQMKAGPMKAKAFIDPAPLINWRDGK